MRLAVSAGLWPERMAKSERHNCPKAEGSAPQATDGAEVAGDCCRDVARAHVRAMEEPSASGRYIASLQHAIDTKLAVDALQQRFPGYKLPKGKQGEREQIIDNSKVGLP